MQTKEKIAGFHERANQVREIAQGVFDSSERQIILRFVADSEKLVAKIATT